MSDSTKTTRLTLLIAGNGFVFVRCLDFTQHENLNLRAIVVLIILGITSLIGVAAGYFALRPIDGALSHSRRAENISLMCITLSALIYLGYGFVLFLIMLSYKFFLH
jgi:hypothetical protein